MTDRNEDNVVPLPNKSGVGYKRPPVHRCFKPGQSGNPSGRAKGSQNLKTLFNKILKEQVSLREGSAVRQVSKAEVLMRGLVIGALKGDARSIGTLFRFAEQAGQLDEPSVPVTEIRRIIIEAPAGFVPGKREGCSE
jgi:hypothetical protein